MKTETEKPNSPVRLPKRARESSKRDYGRLLILAGSRGYTGAPSFASRAAVRGGAGLVWLGVPESIYAVTAVKNDEAMPFPLPCDAQGRLTAEALPEVKDVFHIEVLGTKPSDKYEPGQIVEQDPASGRSRKNNLVIKVYLCAQEDDTLMPPVVGMEFLMAKTELGNLHLDLDVQRAEAYSPDVPEGQVMQSSPAADEPLNKGDTVVLTVSKGPETKPLTVPNFVTMHIDDAAQQAEALGLTVGEHQYEFSDKPEGTVIGQSIQQGTEVQSGTEIVFTVSKGASSAERVVVFDIPEQYRSDSNMKIEVMQDGSIIHSTYVDGGTASFTYTFHGSAGSTSTIKLYINGTEAVAQEITF